LRLRFASVHRKPARRFRQQTPQRQCEQRRQRADDEHVLPAEMGYDPQSHQACRHQADRKHQLVEQHESAAASRLREFADEDGGHRYLAAQPDPLDGSEHEKGVVVPRQRADEAHHPEQRDRPDHRRHSAVALGDPAEQQRAEQLSEEAGRDHQPDLWRGQFPERHDDRQDRGNRQCVEGIEEGGDAHDDARLDLPPGGGEALEPCHDVVDRRTSACGVHLVLPLAFLRCADDAAFNRP